MLAGIRQHEDETEHLGLALGMRLRQREHWSGFLDPQSSNYINAIESWHGDIECLPEWTHAL